jgi:diguanylate cyclase (GGDEF)-like protein
MPAFALPSFLGRGASQSWFLASEMHSRNRPLTFDSRVSLVIGGMLGIVVTAVLVALAVMIVDRVRFEPERARLREAQRAVVLGHQTMLDQEKVLQNHLTAHALRSDAAAPDASALERANAVLGRALGTEPELAALLVNKRLAETALITLWTSIARARDVADDALLAHERELLDAYRAREVALVSGIDVRNRDIEAAMQTTLELGAALELLVLVGVGLFALRQRRALHDAVLEPLHDLLAAIRSVREGKLDAPMPTSGTLELREIGVGLAEMTHTLADERVRREAQENEAREYSHRLRIVLEAAREISESLNLDYVLRAVSNAAVRLARGPLEITIWIVDDETKRLIPTFNSEGPKGAPEGLSPLDIGEGMVGRATRHGRTILEPIAQGDLSLITNCAFPMIVGARVIGVMAARPTPVPRPNNPEFVYVMEMLASHAGAAIESARLHELTERRSHMDALTRSFNRHRLEEDLADECRRSARYARPLSVIMLDVDNFKIVNDTYGHARGDAVLQHVAEAVRGAVRATDSVYRYGGEEFLVMLRETGGPAATELAERLRRRVEQYFTSDISGAVTASFGVAELDPVQPTPSAIIEAADRALYEAKRSGRNCVSVAPQRLDA